MHRWLMGCAAGAVAAFVLGAAAPAGPTTQPSGADRVGALVNGYDEAAERRAFVRVAGSDGELSEDEFATDVKRKGGFVCPYDRWELAVVHDRDGNGRLNWPEAQGYRQALRQRLLKDHDKDGDGKLTGAEMEAASTDLQNGVRRPGHGNATQPAVLASWDVNRNGKLEEPEKKAMREHYMAKARQRRRQWELARYDKDKDGKLSAAERTEMNGALGAQRQPEGTGTQRWDKDGDGKLSEEELKAMLLARHRHGGHPGLGFRRPGPPPWANEGGEGRPPRRSGPPQWANNGGNGGGARRQGPPDWANAGGNGRGRGPGGPVPFPDE